MKYQQKFQDIRLNRIIIMLFIILLNVCTLFACNKYENESINNYQNFNEEQKETKAEAQTGKKQDKNIDEKKKREAEFENLSKSEQLKEILLLRKGYSKISDECINVLLLGCKYKDIASDFYDKNKSKIKLDFEITDYQLENVPYTAYKDFLIYSNKQIKTINVIYETENEIIVGIKDIIIKNITDVDGKIYKLMYDDIVIFDRLIKKNSNWDGLPLTDEFLNNYNSDLGIFKDLNFSAFEINKKGLTSYPERCIDVSMNIDGVEKRYLIKYEVVEKREYKYEDFHNYFKINDISIISVDNPTIIIDHELSRDNYNASKEKEKYESSIKTFLFYRYNNDTELDEPFEKMINKKDIIDIKECLFSEKFKKKFFDGENIIKDNSIKEEYGDHCGYLGCNLDKQLIFLHFDYPLNADTYNTGWKSLFYYSLDKNGLIEDFYCIDTEDTKYAKIGLRNLYTDISYKQGFTDLLNKKPDADVIYVDRFNFALTSSMEEKYKIYDFIPNLKDSSYAKIVDEKGFESSYYNKEIYVDVYFSDYMVRYKIKFELDDYLKLDSIDYSEIKTTTGYFSDNEE